MANSHLAKLTKTSKTAKWSSFGQWTARDIIRPTGGHFLGALRGLVGQRPCPDNCKI